MTRNSDIPRTTSLMQRQDIMDPIYMESIEKCYLFDFEARVVEANPEEGWVALDRTSFYAEGGGQPSDKGSLDLDGRVFPIISVKKGPSIKHHIEGPLPPVGPIVKCHIDPELRMANMKMHTAQHVLSAVIWDMFKARTVGNQIHPDRSHIDFYPIDLQTMDIDKIGAEVNERSSKGARVYVEFLDRKTIEDNVSNERVDLSRLPASVKLLRTVIIGEGGCIDICPCAGTHVRDLKEIGRMEITKKVHKGAMKVRVEYILK